MEASPPVDSSTPLPATINEYYLHEVIGTGSHSRIWRASKQVDENTLLPVAIKEVNKRELSPAAAKRLEAECQIHSRLSHQNIVKLYEIFEHDGRLCFVLELATRGDLLTLVNERSKKSPFSEKEASSLFLQLVDAIEYTHHAGIVHRDIKLDNVLVTSDDQLLLGDWGFSATWSADSLLGESLGSVPYAAPEIQRGKHYFGPEVDIWSLGVVLYALVTGKLPFRVSYVVTTDEKVRRIELFKRICAAKYHVPPTFSPELQDLLSGMLQPDPKLRYIIFQVKYSPWMRKHHPKLQQAFAANGVINVQSNQAEDPAPPNIAAEECTLL